MKSTKFNANWKKDPIFQSWLLPDPMSKHSFKCKTCQVTLDLGNMGRGALVKHNKSVKHIKNSEKTKLQLMELLILTDTSFVTNEVLNETL